MLTHVNFPASQNHDQTPTPRVLLTLRTLPYHFNGPHILQSLTPSWSQKNYDYSRHRYPPPPSSKTNPTTSQTPAPNARDKPLKMKWIRRNHTDWAASRSKGVIINRNSCRDGHLNSALNGCGELCHRTPLHIASPQALDGWTSTIWMNYIQTNELSALEKTSFIRFVNSWDELRY